MGGKEAKDPRYPKCHCYLHMDHKDPYKIRNQEKFNPRKERMTDPKIDLKREYPPVKLVEIVEE
jgi:hypothetical protein